ncbi:MAG: VOC family protein [Pseudohongiellaceae bacterium]
MFNHIMLGSNDLDKAKTFYDATFATLGQRAGMIDEKGRLFYFAKTGTFALTKPIDGESATAANGGTIGFLAESEEAVHAWHEAGLASGGTAIENPPGVRQGAKFKLYIAYLRDPDGNKVCAVYRMT